MQDRFGLVPPEIRAIYENEDALDRQVDTARYIDKALKQHDPHLGIVFVKNVPESELPVGAVANRWHVERKNPGFVSTYWPIVGPNGEFREPTVAVVEQMQRWDLHNESAMRALRERQGRIEAKRAKHKALEGEQRRDELALDLRAGRRVAGEGGLTKSKWGRG